MSIHRPQFAGIGSSRQLSCRFILQVIINYDACRLGQTSISSAKVGIIAINRVVIALSRVAGIDGTGIAIAAIKRLVNTAAGAKVNRTLIGIGAINLHVKALEVGANIVRTDVSIVATQGLMRTY